MLYYKDDIRVKPWKNVYKKGKKLLNELWNGGIWDIFRIWACCLCTVW